MIVGEELSLCSMRGQGWGQGHVEQHVLAARACIGASMPLLEALALGRRLLSVDFRGREGLSFGVLRPLTVLVARPFLACFPPLRVAAASDAAACDSETAVGASDAAATAANASDAAASDVAAAAADADASDTSDAADVSETAVRAASAASHAATTVSAASAASTAMHAPAAARLHLDERALLDSPAREHRLTLEPLAAVVQLEGVSRQPRASADVLVQGTRGLLQVGIDHDRLALLQLHLHLWKGGRGDKVRGSICVTVRGSMCGGPGRGDERACTSGRADSAPNLAASASVASAVAIVASAFAASDFAALAAPSCSLAGSGSGFTSSAAAFAAFNALACLAATVTASASRRLSSFSEALALALTFALAAAACFALACSFATAAILATRAAASGNTVFLAVSADLATDSAVFWW
eukprot:scaffold41281_cov57-Phaeocystis_antarctica.AAC.3